MLRPNRLLKLLLPTVEMEALPLTPLGGVGKLASSERAPKEPMVEERPRRPRRAEGFMFCVECDERTDLIESLRYNEEGRGEARWTEVAAEATCEPEASCDGSVPPWSSSSCT